LIYFSNIFLRIFILFSPNGPLVLPLTNQSPVLNTDRFDPSALTKFRGDLRGFQNERAVYDTHNDRFPPFAGTKDQNSAVDDDKSDSNEGKCILQRIKHPIYYATEPTMMPK